MRRIAPKLFLGLISLGVLLFVFLLGIQLTGTAIHLVGEDIIAELISVVHNPLASFCVGMLLTILVQRSSTVSSLAVLAVGSALIDLEMAIFMLFGANIGTTITSDLVALSHIFQRKSFRSAIGVAAVHDIFNLLTVLILVPLEFSYGLVSKLAQGGTAFLHLGPSKTSFSLPFKDLVSRIADWISYQVPSALVLLFFSIALLVLSLMMLKYFFQYLLKDEGKSLFERQLQPNNAYKSFFFGTLFTAFVQSSSLTTSLSVLFAGTQKLELKRMYPFIIGANLGTTLTAFLAAMTLSSTALTVAFAHLLVNMFGFVLFFTIPFLRKLVIHFAEFLAEKCSRNRSLVFIYMACLFFLIPVGLLYLSQLNETPNKAKQAEKIEKQIESTDRNRSQSIRKG